VHAVRNLDLELAARPAIRPAPAALPRIRWTRNVQLGMALALLAALAATLVGMGQGGIAAFVAAAVGLTWLTHGREGVGVAALVAIGSLPYLAFILVLGAAI
jgi:hypothetical protein